MTKASQGLRDSAAKQMRAARKSRSAPDRVEHTARAASYKELAHNEEWLDGDRERSEPRRPKAKR